MRPSPHIPVMVDESLEALQVVPGGRYCDATLGAGGHARAILERSAPDGTLVGVDRDPRALEEAEEALSAERGRVTLCHGNFGDVVELLHARSLVPVDGFLLNLGVSSMQLDIAERGFSFDQDGPLDMRMDPSSGATAAELIARLTEKELAEAIFRFGEETSSRRIARAVKTALKEGELASTADLKRVVSAALGGRRPRGGRIHPATRTFMALRMVVNDELGSLRRFLDTFTEALRPGGRVVVIAFHSLEDRAVKERFARLADPCVCPPELPVCGCGRRPRLRILTRRPLYPTEEEVAHNPRARSARLRAAEAI